MEKIKITRNSTKEEDVNLKKEVSIIPLKDAYTNKTVYPLVSPSRIYLSTGENVESAILNMSPSTSLIDDTTSSTTTTFSSSKIDNLLGDKQTKLQSGVNIKTINGNSILGAGNIHISGEGEVTIDEDELNAMLEEVYG